VWVLANPDPDFNVERKRSTVACKKANASKHASKKNF